MSHLSYRNNSREATGPHKQTSGLHPCTLESGGQGVGYSKHLRKADCPVSLFPLLLRVQHQQLTGQSFLFAETHAQMLSQGDLSGYPTMVYLTGGHVFMEMNYIFPGCTMLYYMDTLF